MALFARLLFLFVVVPLVELYLLFQFGRWVGVWPTIALVFTTGFLGAALARTQGLRTIWRIRSSLSAGELPAAFILEGLAILLGGALLLTPGLMTDLLGLSALFPPLRRRWVAWVRRRLQRRIQAGTLQFTHTVLWSGTGSDPRPPRGERPDTDPREIVVEPPSGAGNS